MHFIPLRMSDIDVVEDLFIYFIIAAAIILILVFFFVIYYTHKYRAKDKSVEPEQSHGNQKFEVILTLVAVALTTFFLVMTFKAVAAIQNVPDNPKPDLIVTAHQWWWEARYPDSGVVTANEIHIPAGKRILLELNSADVIHDWWVPALGRKMDAFPDFKNHVYMKADKPGTYLGSCSEFCGGQHATMRIRVIAHTQEDFDKWQQEQLRPVVSTGNVQFIKGKALFESKTCTSCHAINGTDYNENIGPNLTHFGSRGRFLSDWKENTKENLRAWLKDPQEVKPMAKMPNFIFSDQELDALVTYIHNLK